MSGPGEVPRDCLTSVLCATFAAVGLAAMLGVAWPDPRVVAEPAPAPRPPVARRGVIARAGEWVTRPDGRRVCRLARDIVWYQVIPASGWCEDWQERAPVHGEVVSWVRSTEGSRQIMVEGEWRP